MQLTHGRQQELIQLAIENYILKSRLRLLLRKFKGENACAALLTFVTRFINARQAHEAENKSGWQMPTTNKLHDRRNNLLITSSYFSDHH